MTDDWFEFLQSLSRAGARFLVVGAHALAVQGVPRGTQGLDVWIDTSPENARRVWAAIEGFGAPAHALGLSLEDLSEPETVIQSGLPPNRIDLLTAVSGITGFDEAWRDREEHSIRDLRIPFLGRRALVANKRAPGRLKDLADLEALGESPAGEGGAFFAGRATSTSPFAPAALLPPRELGPTVPWSRRGALRPNVGTGLLRWPEPG